jgi:hypothetical protein
MIIALDYDGTYNAAPELWDEFISIAERRGHRVLLVTARHDTEENREDCRVRCLPRHSHYFTNHASKRWHMSQLGIKVDVWVDDMPESVGGGR